MKKEKKRKINLKKKKKIPEHASCNFWIWEFQLNHYFLCQIFNCLKLFLCHTIIKYTILCLCLFTINISPYWKVGLGTLVYFWLDRWTGDLSLADVYPNLFLIAYDKEIVVADVFRNRVVDINFSRQLNRPMLRE